jgi:hypothetical protein
MTRTLAVDAVVPGRARSARVAPDRPVGGSVRPASYRFAHGSVRPARYCFARGLVRSASGPSACGSVRFGSRACACVPARSSCCRPASHRRAFGGEPSVSRASGPLAVALSRASPPHSPGLPEPRSARRRDVPGVRRAVVTLAVWSFDPGRDV